MEEVLSARGAGSAACAGALAGSALRACALHSMHAASRVVRCMCAGDNSSTLTTV